MNMTGSRALHGYSAIGGISNSDGCSGQRTHVAGIVGGLTYGVARNATLYVGMTLVSALTLRMSTLTHR